MLKITDEVACHKHTTRARSWLNMQKTTSNCQGSDWRLNNREKEGRKKKDHTVANADYMQIKNTKGKGSNHLRLRDGVKVEDW